MKGIIMVEVECEIDKMNGEEEYVWAIPLRRLYSRYGVHKSKVIWIDRAEQKELGDMKCQKK